MTLINVPTATSATARKFAWEAHASRPSHPIVMMEIPAHLTSAYPHPDAHISRPLVSVAMSGHALRIPATPGNASRRSPRTTASLPTPAYWPVLQTPPTRACIALPYSRRLAGVLWRKAPLAAALPPASEGSAATRCRTASTRLAVMMGVAAYAAVVGVARSAEEANACSMAVMTSNAAMTAVVAAAVHAAAERLATRERASFMDVTARCVATTGAMALVAVVGVGRSASLAPASSQPVRISSAVTTDAAVRAVPAQLAERPASQATASSQPVRISSAVTTDAAARAAPAQLAEKLASLATASSQPVRASSVVTTDAAASVAFVGVARSASPGAACSVRATESSAVTMGAAVVAGPARSTMSV